MKRKGDEQYERTRIRRGREEKGTNQRRVHTNGEHKGNARLAQESHKSKLNWVSRPIFASFAPYYTANLSIFIPVEIDKEMWRLGGAGLRSCKRAGERGREGAKKGK